MHQRFAQTAWLECLDTGNHRKPPRIGRISEAEKQERARTLAMLRLGAEEGPEAVVSLLEKTQGRAVSAEEEARRARFMLNDYKALYAFYQEVSDWPAAGDLLPHITVPCLLYAGERDISYDGVREAAKHIR